MLKMMNKKMGDRVLNKRNNPNKRLYKKASYKKKTKEEAISEIQKWKKDTINKTVEKEGLTVS